MIDNKIWKEYKETKSEELKNLIINEYASLVKIVVGRMCIHTNSQFDFDDLLSYGIFGLIDAIDKFEYEKGIKFESYASLRIRGTVIDNLRKLDWIPRTLRQKNKILDKVTSDFKLINGREPSVEELSEILNLSIKEVEILLKNNNIYNLISLDDYLEESHEKSLENLFDSNIETPEESLEKKELKKMLIKAIDSLNEKQRQVISLYYYEELTLKEISKIMGVSESRISQIHSNSIKILKNSLGKNDVFFYK